MLFAVVGCPRCRRVQVIDGAAARVDCRLCSSSFQPAERKRFYLGEDAEQARIVAAKTSLKLAGASIEVLAEASGALERERTLSLEDVVDGLQRKGEFTAADVEDLLLQSGLTMTAARVVESLRQANRLYEPRPGLYRWIG